MDRIDRIKRKPPFPENSISAPQKKLDVYR
jgi:hypothetical protein